MSGLRPFFGYYGGKWRNTPKHYPSPVFDTIVEPFAGSAGYALNYPGRRVVLCDIDPAIVGVWSYLTRVTAPEILSLPDVESGGSVGDLHVCQEAQWLIGFWLNRAPSSPRRSPSAWMRSGVRPGSFWGSRVRQTIASQLWAIRHWTVRLGSYEVLSVDGPATWFVDPPYQGAGKHYRHGADALDFATLAAWCRARRGQVIVCENEGAGWLPFIALGDVKTTRAGARSREALWLGGVR